MYVAPSPSGPRPYRLITNDGGPPRPPMFRQPPMMCVWPSGFLHSTTDDNFNMRVRLGPVTNTTLELIISSYGRSLLTWASGSFIAVDKMRSPGVRCGVGFGTVIAGFTGLDASNKNGLKVNIDVDQQASDSFKTAESWGDSTMNAFEAMYICY
ncbi:hypothetical protein CGLO_04147 [Colletotrichum gloeosporioides Cg-14]|uniref:Uncharacterized protein n=1 Tax=Colletotrichum gloeosporioides (strain Cg-14) TaxID=1237896 RepID=T0KUU5_COLGC|nr:hypothetical protein CGLO_04147 [Colletotrichum gloeosporioides Cg-14]